MTMERNLITRYPGIRSFSHMEAQIFFGREREMHELSLRTILDPIVVLFGRAGVGKSSLANLIHQNNSDISKYYFRLGVNFNSEKGTLLSRINIENNADNGFVELQKLENVGTDSNKLWLKLKQKELLSINEKPIFLFVLDQFEEVFSWPKFQINSLKSALAEISFGEMPDVYQELLRVENLTFSNFTFTQLFSPLSVRILIVIKSNFLGSLVTAFGDAFPSLLLNCLQLNSLTRNQAITALESPAKIDGSDFITPPFEISPDLLYNTVNALTGVEGEIDPVDLQLVGQALESAVQEKGLTIVRNGDFQDIRFLISKFYETALARLSKDERIQAEIIMEDKLMMQGKRVSLDERILLMDYPMNLLDKLVSIGLLSVEPNLFGGKNYQIIHDHLIDSIEKSRIKRAHRIGLNYPLQGDND